MALATTGRQAYILRGGRMAEPRKIEVHGPPQRVRANGHAWNLRAYARATPKQRAEGAWQPYVLIPPVLDTTPKSFGDMRPPGYWSRGRWIEVRQVLPQEFWAKYLGG
jgi:hypothetical protein